MPREKKSFFERLTGSVSMDSQYDDDLDHAPAQQPQAHTQQPNEEESDWMEEGQTEGQLAVDVYQTPDNIIVKTMVAGMRPEDLDVSITRDMVTLRGTRQEVSEASDGDYFHKELFWGTFSRTILLPAEVEVEEAEAVEKHGLLILKLPKIDKERQTKLKIKSE
ncbi:MAG: Hsp20/alpha crystallin family protein [Candidatus Paceibacterota bacterium]